MSYFIHKSSYIDEDVKIGEGVKIWHFCHIETGASLGKNCILGQNVYIGKNVKIGDGCKIQNNVSVYDGVTLGNHVFCGPSCVFTNDLTPRAKYPKGFENHIKTSVGDGASIGANSTIVCGNSIGKNAMIGAGSVVTKDVPDYALVIGVPAKIKWWVCLCGERLNETFECIICKREYYKKDGNLICNSEI
jgi:UDP-2-acetamido-3-amino-2,3-dideoxy-glucuronate N-acetyltransferase